MNKGQRSSAKRKGSSTKRRSSTARSRITRADMQALAMLDRLVEADRQIEQKYALPFRAPHQVATSLQQCTHCQKDISLLIFGDYARDAAGLEAYARLTADLIQQTALPAYVIAPPAIPATWIARHYCSKCTRSRRNP